MRYLSRMNTDVSKLPELARHSETSLRKFLARIRRNIPGDLDSVVSSLHDEVFEQTDCLSCANCCKTTSPIFYERDVERISRHLKIKPSEFAERFLRKDEDGDYVLKETPCPFLNGENYCSVYDSRPQACREYPHTKRKRIHQVFDLAMKNRSICPAVYNIFEKLKEHYR